MDIIENISLAIEGLKANKMRALLTMLGIIIGIASVIAIVSVGDSLTSSVTSNMEDMGANNIILMVREKDSGQSVGPRALSSASESPEDEDLLSDEAIETFSEHFKDRIEDISLSHSSGKAKAQDGRLYANVSIIGANSGYEQVNNVELLSGRFISEKDTKSLKKVAVVLDKLVSNMFSREESPIGQEIKIYSSDNVETYTIIGVYKHKDSMLSMSFASDKDSSTDTEKFTEDLKEYFAKLYKSNQKWECSIINMENTISTMTSMLGTISIAIAVIAAISLIVGGIGVMNIMLVSVSDRPVFYFYNL